MHLTAHQQANEVEELPEPLLGALSLTEYPARYVEIVQSDIFTTVGTVASLARHSSVELFIIKLRLADLSNASLRAPVKLISRIEKLVRAVDFRNAAILE